MNNNVKIPFGITKYGKIVYIKDKDFKGKEKYKNLYCYDCGGELVPKMGNIRLWHFSHKVVDRKCHASIETWLHKYAKQVIAENDCITIPELWASQYIYYDELTDFLYQCTMAESYNAKYKIVALEKTYKDFKPDAVIQLENGSKVAIEIKVTHKVDKTKKYKVKKNNLDMIEIYLDDKDLINSEKEELLEEDFLKDFILHDAYRKWIFKAPNEALDKKERELKQKEVEFLKKQEEEVEKRRKEFEESQKRWAEEKKGKEQEYKRIEEERRIIELEERKRRKEEIRQKALEEQRKLENPERAKECIVNILNEALNDKNNMNLKLEKLNRFCHNDKGGILFGKEILCELYFNCFNVELKEVLEKYSVLYKKQRNQQ